MNDEVFAAMLFFPGKVVMVFDVKQDFNTKMTSDLAVDARVICRRLFAHQIHRGPILGTGFTIQVQPGQIDQLTR